MRRFLHLLAACLIVLVPAARAQTPAELAQTASFVAALQNPDGGFAARPGGPSTLSSTPTGIRALKYSGGSIKDVPACIAYVKSCFDRETGGFAAAPGGKAEVNTTAVALIALSDLKIASDELVNKAMAFLDKNAKTFEEIRIAVAGLEAVQKSSPLFGEWTAKVNADRNPDGTWGKGASQAFSTGSAAAALLRMGVQPEHKDAVVAALRAGQRADGGWSKDDGPSDLSSCYRIMRALFMLKEKPDIDRIRGFIASCRQPNGGYAVAPGGAADMNGSYYACIITYWTRLLTGEPPIVETAGFAPLFDGKDLTGWEGETSLWSARDGMIVGHSPGIKNNEFLATTKPYGDFILKLSYRLVGGAGNSGVQFRSIRVANREMSGYQADIGEGYWGCLYDESRRNKVLVPASPNALAALNKTGWNSYVLRVMGDQIRLSLNGVQSVSYMEEDANIARDGHIAFQIHAGGPMEVQFKDIYIQSLPSPKADTSATPGFHLRTLKTEQGERRYSLFLPDGYDGQKAFPVVLFLHGSGERGEDGILSAQVGLGAAIARQPDAYPFIAVFPQAKRTWAADSDDAKDALAALDEVMKSFKVDPSRVVLTGLSMGGSGSWSNAAAHPERFSAVVTVCGTGKPEMAQTLKNLPIWCVVGDADRERAVLNAREMVAALRDAGASARETEYRGVPHNSWDRAYSDPAIIEWMLAQKRGKP
jgi:acetyl esterase/lipase/prenyltransferase beta subunit